MFGIRIQTIAFVLLLLLLSTAVASAQVYSTIRGTVLDSSGAVTPNVSVTVTNLDTNIKQTAKSNEVGNYLLPSLIPGHYEVSVEQDGFKSFKTGSIELLSGKDVRVDVHLELGAQNQVITVTGEQGLIETEQATLSDTKSGQVIQTVPFNTGFRSIWRIMDFSPGINSSGGNIAGSDKYRDGSFTIDGVPMMSGWGPVSPGFSYTDSYREMRIEYSGNNASTATAAAVSMVSESGTNDFHGQGWLHYNAPSFTSRSYFSNSKIANHGPPTYRPNLMVGGPVLLGPVYNGHNRTFFHFTYQGLRGMSAPQTSTFVVPSAAYRQGDFSAWSGVVKDPLSGTPFSGNRIPTSRLSGVSQFFQKYYSPVNFGTDSFTNTITTANPDNFWALRGDHQITNKNQIFVRTTYHREIVDHSDNNGEPLVGIAPQFRQQRILNVSDTHTFSPRLFNELRFGYSSDVSVNHGALAAADVMKGSGLNLPSIGGALDTFGMPAMSITGFNGISETNYSSWTWASYFLTESLRYTKGRHNFNIGGEYAKMNGIVYPTSPADTLGRYTFDGSLSGFSYADFILGIPSYMQTTTSVSPVTGRRNSYSLFVTDSWKVTPRLSLELGLRWSLLDPGTVDKNVFANFVPSANALVVPDTASMSLINPAFPKNIPIITADKAGTNTRLQNLNFKNFAPRVGFAWRPTKRDDLVLRGGAGIYYSYLQPHVTDGGGAPFEFKQSFLNVLDSNGALPSPLMFPSPFPTAVGNAAGGTDIGGMDINLRTPYTMQYNFSIQKQVKEFAFTAGYMATLAREGVYSRNLNQPIADLTPYSVKFPVRPYPFYNSASYQVNGSNHNYHALLLTAERRMRNGLFLSTNFTYARDMGTDWTGPENSFDLARDKGQGGTIPRLRYTGTAMYELPFGKGRAFAASAPKVLNILISGWTTSLSLAAQSGRYFTPSYSGVDASNTGITGGRPDRIADGNLADSQRTLMQWFDTTAFVKPAKGIGRFGNAGTYILEGPGLYMLHADVEKDVQLHERLRMRLGATSTNALNHPVFGNPNATVGSSSIGRITGMADNGTRSMQLTLRLMF